VVAAVAEAHLAAVSADSAGAVLVGVAQAAAGRIIKRLL
jgi:hypothetical protein